MTIAIIIAVAWFAVLVVVVALCVMAGRANGDGRP